MSKFQVDPRTVGDDLVAICNSLGSIDENDGTYMKDRDCKACLKELQRYLNGDTKDHTVRTMLGSLNIIKSDLIPLMNQYCDYNDGDPDMFTAILRLCTNLTSSVLLLFENQEIPDDPDSRKVHNKLLAGLHAFKEAFAADKQIWSTLNTHLRHNDGDEITFERLIILIRNILHIPVDSTADMGLHSETDAHTMCIYNMEKSGLLATLVQLMSESKKGTEYCFHLMEIVYLMLREQNPVTVAKAKAHALKRTLEKDDPERKRYEELSARNRRDRETRDARYQPSRFGKVSSIVQVTNCRSLGSEPLVVVKPLHQVMQGIDFDEHKTVLRKARNKKPLSAATSMIISDTNNRGSKLTNCLRIFCKAFVEKVYNNYMSHIKHNLIQKKAQENDESYYLWAIQFFCSFNRELCLTLDNTSETASSSTLHFIQILINSYQDKLQIEKKKFHDISKRMHLALRAYKEILTSIEAVEHDDENRAKLEATKKIIFSDDYRVLMVTLLQQYNEPKHSLHYLNDLIRANDIFLRLSDSQPEMSILSKYCCPDIISAYASVLKHFKLQEDSLNSMVLKFFERIVNDCKSPMSLCQVSIFKVLMDIHDNGHSLSDHKKFIELFKALIQEFGRAANKKRWMYQEALFWCKVSDVVDIEMAIDPPPPQPVVSERLDEEEDDQLAPPQDTIEDLAAELRDSDDEQEMPGPAPTRNSLDDLLAELGDSDSDGDLPSDDPPDPDDPSNPASVGEGDVLVVQTQEVESSLSEDPLASLRAELDDNYRDEVNKQTQEKPLPTEQQVCEPADSLKDLMSELRDSDDE